MNNDLVASRRIVAYVCRPYDKQDVRPSFFGVQTGFEINTVNEK